MARGQFQLCCRLRAPCSVSWRRSLRKKGSRNSRRTGAPSPTLVWSGVPGLDSGLDPEHHRNVSVPFRWRLGIFPDLQSTAVFVLCKS